MAKVDIPVDLSSIKTTQFWGLTTRQLKFVSIALTIALPVYYFTYKDIGYVAAFIVFFILIFLISAPGFFGEENELGREIKKQVRQKYYYKQIRVLGKEDKFDKEKRKGTNKKQKNKRK